MYEPHSKQPINGAPEPRANTWALVLAAGDGSRLRSLTTTSNGLNVPKQYCSLSDGPSFLHDALLRARSVAPTARVCCVVARQHRRWWDSELAGLPPQNVIVQPENRGTAHGILLPLLQVYERDPNAVIVLLPADHFVRDEPVLAGSLRQAAAIAHANPEQIVLLGVQPDCADPELGYVVPAADVAAGHDAAPVAAFVEKPTLAAARALLQRGALWNAFIIAASVRSLLSLYGGGFAATVASMRTALAQDRGDPRALTQLYGVLTGADFSRDVLQTNVSRLRVLCAGQCGWTDLGTPQRVADTLRRSRPRPEEQRRRIGAASFLNLAVQHRRLQQAGDTHQSMGAAP